MTSDLGIVIFFVICFVSVGSILKIMKHEKYLGYKSWSNIILIPIIIFFVAFLISFLVDLIRSYK